MEMDTEKRLERLERLLAEEDKFAKIERKSVRFVALVLLLFALTALVIWGLVELISFTIHRIQALHLW
ncbi:MAG TPA: hypothetical protein VK421_02940 [Pyrinomonadaceae bacterium]|nr:hypothetical protein [Pyrinomonadaceae bacterium]